MQGGAVKPAYRLYAWRSAVKILILLCGIRAVKMNSPAYFAKQFIWRSVSSAYAAFWLP